MPQEAPEPFDGNAPDALMDDMGEFLDRFMDKMRRLQSWGVARGITSIVVVNVTDPLTDLNHLAYSSKGNRYANIGAMGCVLGEMTSLAGDD